jgi:hypothetical protein
MLIWVILPTIAKKPENARARKLEMDMATIRNTH